MALIAAISKYLDDDDNKVENCTPASTGAP